MATRIYLAGSTATHPRAKRVGQDYEGLPQYRDIRTIRGTGLTQFAQATTGPAERRICLAGGAAANGVTWWSERVAADFTLTGDIIFHIWAAAAITPTPARLRARLYKITAGGGDVQTLIGEVDDTTDLAAASSARTLTLTGYTPLTIAANERFLLRLFVFCPGGQTPTSGAVATGATSVTTGDSWIDVPADPTFRANPTNLSPRRTTGTGIGNFMDLLDTFGAVANTTAIVNTVASGGEIVWTKTAGGLIAEWVTPRLKSQWELPALAADGANMLQVQMPALESATTANISIRYKIFARDPNGVESLVFQNDMAATELTTAMNNWVITPPLTVYNGLTTIGEDWRLVFRAYIIPVTGLTMASGRTGTFGYDGPLPTSTVGTALITLFDLPAFKLETDPAKSPVIPSGGSGGLLGGVSNGQ